MKLDPNLVSIRTANMENIMKGDYSTAIRHAQDYLNHIVKDPVRAKLELDYFVSNLKEVRNNAS